MSSFDPLQLGPLSLPSRIVVAPTLRRRAQAETGFPTPMTANHSVQRTEASLVAAQDQS